MAFTVIEHAMVDGNAVRPCVTIKLMGHEEVPSFAIVYHGDGLYAIAHRTNDYGCARLMFSRSISLARQGFTHPAWRTRRKIEIAS